MGEMNILKKTVALVMAFFLAVCSFQMLALAQNGWDGVEETKPSGKGTKNEPYLISSPEELAWYRTQINKYDNTSCAKLLADIDLNGKEWMPIGRQNSDEGFYYAGDFDGNGHTVRGLYINASNADSISYDYGFFGTIRGLSETNRAAISNLTIEGSVTYNRAVQQAARGKIGGLVGSASKVDISGCTVNVTVTAIKESNDTYYGSAADISSSKDNGLYSCVGGFCGAASNVTLTNCMNKGNVTGTGISGGIVGEAGTGGVIFQCCCNIGDVTGYGKAGGIVGKMLPGTSKSTEYRFCYNSGSVNAIYDFAGGLIGLTRLSDGNNTANVLLVGCFSVGNVKAPLDAGGCLGYLEYYAGTLTLNDVCYLDTSAEDGFGQKWSATPVSVIVKDLTEMASPEYVSELNEDASLFGVEEDVFKTGRLHPLFIWQEDEIPDTTLGDINGDGTVNAADVSELISLIAKDNAPEASIGDMNGDGTVNAADVSELIAIIVGN